MVVADLQNPREKHWGALIKIDANGLWLRGLNLATFDDWIRQFSSEEVLETAPTDHIGLSTSFFPMHRVERVTLDEPVGDIPSYIGRLEEHIGREGAQRIFARQIPLTSPGDLTKSETKTASSE